LGTSWGAGDDPDLGWVELVVLFEPLREVCRCGLQRIGKRVRDTRGHPELRVFKPRLAGRRAADHVDRKSPIHGSFKRIPGKLAVALRCMAIADEKESTGMVDRQVNRGAFHELVVIHVAPECSGISRSEGLVLRRRDSYTTEHGPQRHAVICELLAGIRQPGEARLTV